MKTHAFGTKFIWDGNQVGSLNNIGGVEISVDTVDVTAHDSEGGFKEFIVGLMDAGEVALSGYFDSQNTNGQIAMLEDCTAREVRQASIIFPASTGSTWAFTGLITNIKIGDNPTDDGIPFTATVKVSGKPILTVSTSAGLTDLSLTGATLIPSFSASANEFFATAVTETENVKVTPTAVGTIKVNGTTVISAATSGDIALGVADSVTKITVSVTETDKAPKNYTISVLRAAS